MSECLSVCCLLVFTINSEEIEECELHCERRDETSIGQSELSRQSE